jgi:hypothetical protein
MTIQTSTVRANCVPSREVAIFAADVPDMQTLIDGLRPGVAHYVLSPDGDGLAEIATCLAGHRDLEALHIVSHGAPGRLVLGGLELSRDALSEASGLLGAIRSTLSIESIVSLHACDVAKGDDGASFVDALSKALDRSVLASTTAVGYQAGLSDWHLDYGSRFGHSSTPFFEENIEVYRGSLAITGPTTITFDTVTGQSEPTINDLKFNDFNMVEFNGDTNAIADTATDTNDVSTTGQVISSIDGRFQVGRLRKLPLAPVLEA